MGILGIRNRTENWKTAHSFAPFFTNEAARAALANRLLEPLEKDYDIEVGKVKIELFWKGMRDHIHVLDKECKATERTIEKRRLDIAERYACSFPDLRSNVDRFIEQSCSPKCMQTHNYSPMEDDEEFYNNLRNTEIDIVLATPRYLFVGEAKHESSFDVNDKYVLMHQLIREYVMAKLLVNCRGENKKVVSFVVGDNPAQLKEPHRNLKHIHQISFLLDQRWLKEENVLSWESIDEIAAPEANHS